MLNNSYRFVKIPSIDLQMLVDEQKAIMNKNLNEIKRIEKLDTNKKEDFIELYRTNVERYIEIFLVTTDFSDYLKTTNYFDALFLKKDFLKSLLQTVNDSYKLTIDPFFIRSKSTGNYLNVEELIRLKIKQNNNVYYTMEAVLQDQSFFRSKISLNYKMNDLINYNVDKIPNFIDFYNIQNTGIDFVVTTNLINYCYYRSDTILMTLISNIGEEQKQKLVEIFTSKRDLFSYFLLNNDKFFTLIKNENTFLDILFTNPFIIRSLMETGNIQKIADLLELKMEQPIVMQAMKPALAMKRFQHTFNYNSINYNYGILFVNHSYEVYTSFYKKIKEKFSDETSFIEKLELELSQTIYINNNDTYNNFINKCLQSYFLDKAIISNAFLNSATEEIKDFIHLFPNNSYHIQLLGLPDNNFLFGSDIDHENIKCLFYTSYIVRTIFRNKDYYLENFRLILLRLAEKNFDYTLFTIDLTQNNSENIYDKPSKKRLKDIYLKHFFTATPNRIIETILKKDPGEENYIISFCSKSPDSIPTEVIINPIFINFMLQNNDQITELFLSSINKIPFALFLMDKVSDEKIAQLVENKIQDLDILNISSKAFNAKANYLNNDVYLNINKILIKNILNFGEDELLLNIHQNIVNKFVFLLVLEENIDLTIRLLDPATNFTSYLAQNKDLNHLFTNYNFFKAYLYSNYSYYEDRLNFFYDNMEYKCIINNIKIKMQKNSTIAKVAQDLFYRHINKVPNYAYLYDDIKRFDDIDFTMDLEF